jgi:AAA15 family ATPase/GTPase
MIKDLEIRNFRGFESIAVRDMNRISLFSGRNNIGKSTILEALFLVMDHGATDSFALLNGLRGSSASGVTALWEPLFFQFDTKREIGISIREENDLTSKLSYKRDNNYLPYTANGVPEDMLAAFRSVTKNSYSLLFAFESGDYTEEGHFLLNGVNALREIKTNLPGNEIKLLQRTRYLSPSVVRLTSTVLNDIGDLELQGKKADIVEILQELDVGIEDVVTLSVQGITQLYLKVSGKLIPIQYAGDGVMKLLQICMAVMESQGGLVLIDEIETGFHYSMYEKLWAILDKISALANCQIIATTHSYEMIAAVQDGLKQVDDFSYYRLDRNEKGHVAHRYDYAMLDSALKAEMEVR